MQHISPKSKISNCVIPVPRWVYLTRSFLVYLTRFIILNATKLFVTPPDYRNPGGGGQGGNLGGGWYGGYGGSGGGDYGGYPGQAVDAKP